MQDSVEERPQATSPVHHLKQVPVEFRHLLQSFTAFQLHDTFPSAHSYKRWPGTDFYWREYLGPVMFMDRNQVYRFAFSVESDVRYTGRSWGNFFNAALHIASRTLSNQDVEETPGDISLDELSKEDVPQPDLILFPPFLLHPEDVVSHQNLQDNRSWPFPTVISTGMTLFGFSRRMNDQLLKHSRAGHGGFIEQFVPSVAFNEDVNTVIVSVGVYGAVDPLHCCVQATAQAYDRWFLSDDCWNSIPMHPIKNNNLTVWSKS